MGQELVEGSFTNGISGKLELLRDKTYSGNFDGPGPQAILDVGNNTIFKHKGESPKGSKLAVEYRGPNQDLWIFACHVQADAPKNKVFGKHVEKGTIIEWDQIEKELDESKVSDLNEQYFLASVTPIGSKAELSVIFRNQPYQGPELVESTFTNGLSGKLELLRDKTFSGNFDGPGPQAILFAGNNTIFKHKGESPEGSKLAVEYRGPNQDLWIFAWHVQANAPKNKVYGKHVEKGTSIEWDEIEKELDESNVSELNTEYFNASITPIGSKAELHATFQNVPKN